MLEVLQYIIATLIADSTLTALVPASHIFTGAVDVLTEKQAELLDPQVNIHVIADTSRTVPTNVRDVMIQIDIWSRTDYLTTANIAERIITLLNYQIADQSTAHIFWERLGGGVDLYESDRRVYHKALTYVVWSEKP